MSKKALWTPIEDVGYSLRGGGTLESSATVFCLSYPVADLNPTTAVALQFTSSQSINTINVV